MTFAIFAIAAALLIALGLHAALVRPHFIRRILALNVISGGTFLLLVALPTRETTGAAIDDPVPKALVLTGIVVTVSISAFAVTVARQLHRITARATLDEGNLE